jgi:fluoroacetyl-CoA thioesterase
MKSTLSVGLTHETSILVDRAMTVPALPLPFAALRDMPPVFATGLMVAFMETACVEALAPHLDPGEHSVGIAVDVTHVAATPVGMRVTARVALTAVERRTLTFAVEAFDEAGPIGKGVHRRAVIDTARFMARVAQKAGAL